MNDLLELCPFCGAAPEILPKKTIDSDTGEIVEGVSIQCVNRMCGMRPYTYPCREENIWMFRANWNMRYNAIELTGSPKASQNDRRK